MSDAEAPPLTGQTRCALHAQPGWAAELGSRGGRRRAVSIAARVHHLFCAGMRNLNHWQVEQAYVPNQEYVRIAEIDGASFRIQPVCKRIDIIGNQSEPDLRNRSQASLGIVPESRANRKL